MIKLEKSWLCMYLIVILGSITHTATLEKHFISCFNYEYGANHLENDHFNMRKMALLILASCSKLTQPISSPELSMEFCKL